MNETVDKEISPEEKLIVQVGLDVLGILSSRFEKDMGRQFQRTWVDCLEGVEGLPGFLFAGLHSGEDNRDINARIVQARWEGSEGREPARLLEAFLQVIDAQISAVRRVLGQRLVGEAAGEAVRMLSMVEKYKGSSKAVQIFMDRLEQETNSTDITP